MMSELRTTIEFTDIKAIEVECGKCHARSVRQVDRWERDMLECGNCGAIWMLEQTPDFNNLKALVRLLAHYSKAVEVEDKKAKSPPFILRLEITGVEP